MCILIHPNRGFKRVLWGLFGECDQENTTQRHLSSPPKCGIALSHLCPSLRYLTMTSRHARDSGKGLVLHDRFGEKLSDPLRVDNALTDGAAGYSISRGACLGLRGALHFPGGTRCQCNTRPHFSSLWVFQGQDGELTHGMQGTDTGISNLFLMEKPF